MKKLRCAIYTRKSSEEGLEQSFNSLDAQREACEAYILSQKSEGWTALPALYDDGGFSGGTMARPGLEKLLRDVAAGQVDVVVVYKVDRLTRSLADFAKIVEIFDRHGASFVSVTQAFNTTSSMGRLTLNVLLSFAQFEREVTGERIRDKIAASKAKGMWMGGYPPFGYDADNRTLRIVEEEAEMVRHIFRRYLALGSVHALADELDADGIKTKIATSAKGITRGGTRFGRGNLFHLLRNRIYLGEIVHKEKSYPGQHQPVIDRELFENVQQLLNENRVTRSAVRTARSPLCGLLHDAAGARMTAAHAIGRAGIRYRYYVSAPLQTGTRASNNPDVVRRVPADTLEQLVMERLRAISGRPAESWQDLVAHVRRIEVHARTVVIEIMPPPHADWEARVPRSDMIQQVRDGVFRVSFSACVNPRGGNSWVVTPPTRSDQRRKPDAALIAALRRAHAELRERNMDVAAGKLDLGSARGLGDPYLRRIAPLAFLAPDIQRSIIEGRQPFGITLKRLTSIELPLDWAKQRSLFGYE